MIGQETQTAPETLPAANPPAFKLSDVGLALVPVIPVKFTGTESVLAWGRLIIYGGAAALTWQKQRQLSYLLIGAAGLSLVSSMAGNAWSKEGKK